MQKSTLWQYWGSGEKARQEFPNGAWQEWYVTGHQGQETLELMLVSDVRSDAHIHSVGCMVRHPRNVISPIGEYYTQCEFVVAEPQGRISIGSGPAVTWETDEDGVTWLSDFDGRRLYRKNNEAWQEEIAPLDYERTGVMIELVKACAEAQEADDWARAYELECILEDDKELDRRARARCLVRADKATD